MIVSREEKNMIDNSKGMIDSSKGISVGRLRVFFQYDHLRFKFIVAFLWWHCRLLGYPLVLLCIEFLEYSVIQFLICLLIPAIALKVLILLFSSCYCVGATNIYLQVELNVWLISHFGRCSPSPAQNTRSNWCITLSHFLSSVFGVAIANYYRWAI